MKIVGKRFLKKHKILGNNIHLCRDLCYTENVILRRRGVRPKTVENKGELMPEKQKLRKERYGISWN